MINGKLREISGMAVPIVAKFEVCMAIGGIRINKSDFYVLRWETLFYSDTNFLKRMV